MKRFASTAIILKKPKLYFHLGYSFSRLAFGISVDRWTFNIDFAFFWFSIEW